MHKDQSPRATTRDSWFAELSEALDEGERVLAELVAAGISPAETGRLRLRLVELRAEIGRLSRAGPRHDRIVGPGWPGSSIHAAASGRALHPDWQPRRD